MIRTITIFYIALLVFSSCQNTGRIKEQLPDKPANTSYLKNSHIVIDTTLLRDAPKHVREIYADNGYVTLWTDPTDRLELQQALKNIEADGLQPENYNLTFIADFEALQSVTKQDCMRYDIMLTQSFTTLATHLFKGKLKPSGVYSDWSLAPKKLDTKILIIEALQNHTIVQVINRCRPRHAIYNSLRKSLAHLNALPDDANMDTISIIKPITYNDSAAVISLIKKRLIYWKDLDTVYASGHVYNKATAAALKKFQERHGIVPNGIVNSRTVQALNFTRNRRREQVIANLERWRWFPYDFGERAIVINIPDYGLAVVENNTDTIQTFKIVVGKPARRTPVLQSALSNLVINPTWTVPPTILKEDLTPSAVKDRSHFTNLNMKIFKGDTEVLAQDWDPEIADTYRYVQGPGDHNALGRIKFNFRNGYSVYIHDTNHKENFGKHYRALSSGCVRVENPFKLAGYVLDRQAAGWTKDKMDEMVATGETQNVYIQKSIQVHQLYWTAWMDKSGLQFRNDIYSLDTLLYTKLRS